MCVKGIVVINNDVQLLQSLLDKCKELEIVGVVANVSNNKINKLTTSLNIPCLTMDEFLTSIIDVEFLILLEYNANITSTFLQYVKSKNIKIVNMHPALTSRYSGDRTMIRDQVLASEDERHGITIKLNESEKDILVYQHSCYVTDSDLCHKTRLDQKIRNMEQEYYPIVMDLLASGYPVPFTNDVIGEYKTTH